MDLSWKNKWFFHFQAIFFCKHFFTISHFQAIFFSGSVELPEKKMGWKWSQYPNRDPSKMCGFLKDIHQNLKKIMILIRASTKKKWVGNGPDLAPMRDHFQAIFFYFGEILEMVWKWKNHFFFQLSGTVRYGTVQYGTP